MQYEIASQRIAHVIVESAVPLGYWRSAGHSQNAFFKEAFLDEVAAAVFKLTGQRLRSLPLRLG